MYDVETSKVCGAFQLSLSGYVRLFLFSSLILPKWFFWACFSLSFDLGRLNVLAWQCPQPDELNAATNLHLTPERLFSFLSFKSLQIRMYNEEQPRIISYNPDLWTTRDSEMIRQIWHVLNMGNTVPYPKFTICKVHHYLPLQEDTLD